MPENDATLVRRFHLKSLERIGDLYIPGDEALPAFSQSGCVAYADEFFASIDRDDLTSLKRLLTVLRFMPRFVIRALLDLIDRSQDCPEWLAGWLRLLNLALKGTVMSLYYSGFTASDYQGPDPLEVIDYHIHCEPGSKPSS